MLSNPPFEGSPEPVDFIRWEVLKVAKKLPHFASYLQPFSMIFKTLLMRKTRFCTNRVFYSEVYTIGNTDLAF